ncbi:MAG: DUF4114 domain-containing protein, partial [Candidatus Marinimicrobia bacterium]|nr:DUF4114 domain-containing protein [Candidatus Neomarinimicrobiota bacterium]
MKIRSFIFLTLILVVMNSAYGQYNYHSAYYNDLGLPFIDAGLTQSDLVVPSDVISSEMLQYITDNLPERVAISSSLLKYQIFQLNFSGSSDAEVWITFVHEGAQYCNSLGYYTYSGNDEPTVTDILSEGKIVFPNVTDPDDPVGENHAGNLNPGDKIKIGAFPSGTKFAWFVVADGWDPTNYNNVNRVSEKASLGTLYSVPSLNDNNKIHCIYLEYEPFLNDNSKISKVLMGFEDQKTGDDDYNDVIFYISTYYDYSLPIELSSFTGKLGGGTVELSWTTGSEIDNRGFILERQENDGHWVAIAS